MVLRIPKVNDRKFIFFLSFSLYMFFTILHASFFVIYFINIHKFIMLLCILLLFLYEIANSKMSKRELIGAIFLYSLGLWVIWRGGRSESLAIGLLYAFSSRNISFTKIAKISFLISSVLLVSIICCSQLGIIQDYINMRFSLTGLNVRHYLGFRYVLNGPIILLHIILLYMYIRKEKMKFAEISVLFLVSVWMFFATDARLSFLLSVFSLLIATINRYRKDNYSSLKIIPCMLIFSYLVSCAIILLLTVFYSPTNDWMVLLDFLLAGRLSISQISIKEYGINLFGSKVEWLGNGLDELGNTKVGEYAYLWVDSLYIQMFQRDGIVFTIIFLCMLTLLMYKFYKKRDNLLLIIFSIRAVQCMIESSMQSLRFNTFLLFIGIAFFGYLNEKESDLCRIKNDG